MRCKNSFKSLLTFNNSYIYIYILNENVKKHSRARTNVSTIIPIATTAKTTIIIKALQTRDKRCSRGFLKK